jgi:hypothetical protein
MCQSGKPNLSFKMFPACFVGCEVVDFLVQPRLASSRDEAVELGRQVERQLNFFHHVSFDHAFKDEYKFYYRFVSSDDSESGPRSSTSDKDSAGSSISSGAPSSKRKSLWGAHSSLEEMEHTSEGAFIWVWSNSVVKGTEFLRFGLTIRRI